jgi:hypothetical protein
MNRASIGATSFKGSAIACPVSRASASALSKQIAMHGRRQFDGQFHRLFIGDGTELELCHVRSLTFVRLKHEVAVDDHAHWKPRPDRQRRLDVEILLNDLLTSLVQAIAGPAAEC